MKMLSREEAAEYLTERSGIPIKPVGLAARATKGNGPKYAIFNGRAVYSAEALDEWLNSHLANAQPAARQQPRAA